MNLRHSYQTGISQRHRDVAVGFHQVLDRQDFLCEREFRHYQTATDEIEHAIRIDSTASQQEE